MIQVRKEYGGKGACSQGGPPACCAGGCVCVDDYLRGVQRIAQHSQIPRFLSQIKYKFPSCISTQSKNIRTLLIYTQKISKISQLQDQSEKSVSLKYISTLQRIVKDIRLMQAYKEPDISPAPDPDSKLPKTSYYKNPKKQAIPASYWQKLKKAKQQDAEQTRQLLSKFKEVYSEFVAASRTQIEEKSHVFTHYLNNCLGCQRTSEQINTRTGQAYYIVDGGADEKFLEAELPRLACILLNCGGGYLLSSRNLAQKMEKAKGSIYPTYFKIEEVALQEDQHRNVDNRHHGFKLVLTPTMFGQVFSIAVKNRYSCIVLDGNEHTKMEDANLGQSRYSSVYSYDLIHKKYKEKMELQCQFSRGYPIRMPAPTNSKCVKSLTSLGYEFLTQVMGQKAPSHGIYDQPEQFYDKQMTMVLMGPGNHDTFMHQVQDYLIAEKYPRHAICRPYKNYKKEAKKSLWFISHNYTLKKMQEVIKGKFKSPQRSFLFEACSKNVSVQVTQKKDIDTLKTKLRNQSIKFDYETNSNMFKFESFKDSVYFYATTDRGTFCHSNGEKKLAGEK